MEPSRCPTSPDELEAILTVAFPKARDDVRSVLLETVEMVAVEAGLPITDQGRPADLLLVTSGYVGLRRTTIGGREIMPRLVTTGELVTISRGERAPPFGSIALTSCEMAAWKPADVHALAANDAGFALDLLDHALDALETTAMGLDGRRRQDAVPQVARVLHRHRTLFFGDPPILSSTHLSALVGATRSATRRAVRVLEARAIIAYTPHGGILLRDPEGLEATADVQ